MKHTLKTTFLMMLTMLGACSHETDQTRLRQIINTAQGSYELATLAVIPLLKDEVKGVKLTAEQKAILKRAANVLAAEINSATTSIEKGYTLSELTVNSIQTGVQEYVACLENIKLKASMPETCVSIGG